MQSGVIGYNAVQLINPYSYRLYCWSLYMNLEHARFNMIEQQIRPWSVLDEAVLATFGFVRRECFVPTAHQALAFMDTDIPLGSGEFMMPPRLEARMIQSLKVQPEDTCLEVGTGSGFVTACLAHMSRHVDSVDIYDDFTAQADARLKTNNIRNYALHTGDALRTWSGNTLYNVIALTGSLPNEGYLARFQEQLAIGGRVFAIVGTGVNMQALLVTRNAEDEFTRQSLFDTYVKPLVGSTQGSGFTF
jgi:protein-L-isoaspartate(D-aspartate) O-methyltransferase